MPGYGTVILVSVLVINSTLTGEQLEQGLAHYNIGPAFTHTNNTLDEEIWNFEIATTENPKFCDLSTKKILIQIQTDNEPLFKKIRKNVFISEFLKTMSVSINVNADFAFNEQIIFEGKSNQFTDLATDVLALKWDSQKEANNVLLLDLGKYDLVVYFSSKDLPGSFFYEARIRKTPIWHFNLAKDDGSVSSFFGQKNFFVNPKQARRFVLNIAGEFFDTVFVLPLRVT